MIILKVSTAFEWVKSGQVVYHLRPIDDGQRYIAYVNKGEWFLFVSLNLDATHLASGETKTITTAKAAVMAAAKKHGMIVEDKG